jgi:hypothetical protein
MFFPPSLDLSHYAAQTDNLELSMQHTLASNLQSSCHRLLSAEITGVHDHVHLPYLFFMLKLLCGFQNCILLK